MSPQKNSKNNGKGGKQKTNNGSSTATIAARRQKEWELRIEGMSYRSIGKECGISRTTVMKDIHIILEELHEETKKEARHYVIIELRRLDKMQAGLWTEAIKGSEKHVHAVLRIMERRSKLLGLDAPLKIDIEHQIRTFAEREGIDPDRAVEEAERIIREYESERA